MDKLLYRADLGEYDKVRLHMIVIAWGGSEDNRSLSIKCSHTACVSDSF